MTIAFTGTRHQPTALQIARLHLEIVHAKRGDFPQVRHGDCVGADKAFHRLCLVHALVSRIGIHPPVVSTLRAYCADMVVPGKMPEIIVHPPQDYLDRNQTMVDNSDMLIAVPETQEEKLKSGTWSTVRKARKKGLPIVIIGPEQTVREGGA